MVEGEETDRQTDSRQTVSSWVFAAFSISRDNSLLYVLVINCFDMMMVVMIFEIADF